MTPRFRRTMAFVLSAATVTSCAGGGDEPLAFDSRPSTIPPVTLETTRPPNASSRPTVPSTSVDQVGEADVVVTVDATAPGATISPAILGLSSTLTPAEFRDLGVTLNSWGGNPATRYNYRIGNAWNHGADWEFRNTNYGGNGDVAREFLATSQEAGIANRVAVPTLGWVAKDDLEDTCSFPDGSGGCLAAADVGTCADPREVADPATANVPSTVDAVTSWVAGLVADGYDLTYIAMDNEPELWGSNHVDVHPECPTYEEVLDKYLTYASAIREVAPDSKLTGPVVCCWYDFWNTAPGPEEGPAEDYLAWFLRNVREHDESTGVRTIDAVDVHYYPQSGVFNDDSDPDTSAKRLRSTRALWDPEYVDESWIGQPIRFIPRIRETIEAAYPGLPIIVSEWNFGADTTMNGALAIADVLGIYGREGVEAAAYWRNPPVGSPGAFAFKMHGNYDGAGSRFAGAVVPVTVGDDESPVHAYAAVDGGTLRVMLINEDPTAAQAVRLDTTGFDAVAVERFTYGQADLTSIVTSTAAPGASVELPSSSITVLELTASS